MNIKRKISGILLGTLFLALAVPNLMNATIAVGQSGESDAGIQKMSLAWYTLLNQDGPL